MGNAVVKGGAVEVGTGSGSQVCYADKGPSSTLPGGALGVSL